MSPTEPAKRKRKRIIGTFKCPAVNCGKVFSRADHLGRHQRSHNPGSRYACPYPNCGQTFTRHDVKEKHFKRHTNGIEKSKRDEGSVNISHTESTNFNDYGPSQILSAKLGDGVVSQSPVNVSKSGNEAILEQTNELTERNTLSPTDLIEWLFHDELSVDNSNSGTNLPGHSTDLPSGFSPVSLIETMFAVSPNFPNSNYRIAVNENIRSNLISFIPSLEANPDFGCLQIEECLSNYWLLYHPQYPILHRPSFLNSEAPPLLLLAMVMLGSNFVPCAKSADSLLRNPKALADQIAEPLRWLIFANIDCRPPAKVWVVQSLLLLETYEITSSSRFLHERAYLHHGSKIQLLRRSPILGGDPLKSENHDGAYSPPNQVWKTWIEVESMKRATLMAFYLDTIHATVYGHSIILYAHQLKLSLPCEDVLWEFDNTNKSETLSFERTPKFLAAMNKLLHRQKVVTSSFGKKVLLAGLLTIMFQMQQKDLQLSFLEWDSMKDSWNQTISLAIDVWRADICTEGGCCDTENSLWFPIESKKKLPPMLRIDDTRCKFGLYHIAQIYMRISHYDYIIYAGAPSRMNVKAGKTEYEIVAKRVMEWSHSLNGSISAIHAYWFLCEMILSPDNEDITFTYDPNTDPFMHRKNIIASAVLVLFAYNYSLHGPESVTYDQLATSDYYPDKEDGYSYLRRIRKCLSRGPGGPFHRINYGRTSAQFHEAIKLHSETLRSIDNKHHLVGLLKLFYRSYKGCNWEIGREYSKLFRNCIKRCLGRKSVVCDDMYVN
ncbi:hypothetical protein G9P44_003042 [Scheffersomyces stipitis]|nr:hypothetical protein G9P44_003042 [Scheffersomyces stipitis]